MTVCSFDELMAHWGHKTTVTKTRNPDGSMSIAVECLNCKESLVSYHKTAEENKITS